MNASAVRSTPCGAFSKTMRSGNHKIRTPARAVTVCAFNPNALKQSALAAAAAIAVSVASPFSAQALCPDLITAPSGLKYCDVTIGTGDAPVKGAFIKVHYDGRLDADSASGKFDSSYDRGRPLGFAVSSFFFS